MSIALQNPSKIQWLTIHCTATPEGRPNTAAEIMAMDRQRFGQPSYHYVIELDGKVVQCLREDQRGAHVALHNTGNIGISYVGGTTTLNTGAKAKDTRTPKQQGALEVFVRDFIKRHPNARIRGHREWPGVAKDCPSFDVKAWLTKVGLGKYSGA